MATKIEPPRNEEEKQESFTITDEMQQLIDLRKAAGQITKLDTDEEKHRFGREFHTWVKAGSPRPKMPVLVTIEDPIPQKLYRIKHMGRQKIFWRDTKNVMHGKEFIKAPIMKIVKDAQTGEDMEVVERYDQKVNYTIDYTKVLGEKLLDDAIDRCFNPTFYVIAGEKALVGPKEFNTDFDQLLDKIRKAARRITD